MSYMFPSFFFAGSKGASRQSRSSDRYIETVSSFSREREFSNIYTWDINWSILN